MKRLKTEKRSLPRLVNLLAWVLVWVVFLELSVPARTNAQLSELDNAELAQITGTGATNLYIDGNTVRLFLDVHIETYGEIDSLKAAYYEKGDPLTYGWDMDWNGLTLGESMEAPLVTDGIVFRTEFDDISASNKQLNRIVFGTNNMVGRISGDFTTTTGAVNPAVVGEAGTDPIEMDRSGYLQAYGALDIDGGFFMEINFVETSPERGIKTIIGYPENQAVSFGFGTDWWHQ